MQETPNTSWSLLPERPRFKSLFLPLTELYNLEQNFQFLVPLFFLVRQWSSLIKLLWEINKATYTKHVAGSVVQSRHLASLFSLPCVTPVPFSCWTTQDAKQRQKWLWSVTFLSPLLPQKHTESILRNSVSCWSMPIQLGVPPALAKASAKMSHFLPISFPCIVFLCSRRSVDPTCLSENLCPHSYLDFSESWSFLSLMVSSLHVTISGKVLNLMHFSQQSQNMNVGRNPRDNPPNPCFKGWRNWGPEKWGNLVT